jgi:hypothetical protein
MPDHPDADAWKRNLQYNQVYNKLWLMQTQNVDCAPCPIEPSSYPVFYKPIINLYSLGCCAFKANRPVSESKKHPGLFWSEYLTGKHWTFDAKCQSGELVNAVGLEGHKSDGVFDYWEPMKPNLSMVRPWSKRYLVGYSGPINFELIGDTIIECHLRNSNEIKKVYPDNYPSHNQSEASEYIVPIYAEPGIYDVNDMKLKWFKRTYQWSSIYMTIEDGKPEMGSGPKRRVGYITTPKLSTGKTLRGLIKREVLTFNRELDTPELMP